MTDQEAEPSPALDSLLRKAAADPRFMASVLDRAGSADPSALAARLGCPPESLSRLALCLRPDETSDRFADAVRRIADYARCDPTRLRDLLRETAAVEHLRSPAGEASIGHGLLLAARDRNPERDEDPPDETAPFSRDR